MSLPRRPSVGLPPTPRARSFTAGPARQDIIPRPRSAASERLPPSRYQDPPPLPPQARALRPARSIAALPVRPTGTVRSRSADRRADPRHGSSYSYSGPPPPLPSLPRSPRAGLVQGKRNVPMHAAARSVDYNAYRPRDTVEDPIADSSSSSGASDASARSPPSSRTSMNEGDMKDKTHSKPPAGFGSSLWGNITGVASNLTISVSKAWSTNLATYSGEETPAGAESHLTRAMKAYHIEKARDPADLPDWLFDERERGVYGHGHGHRAPSAGAPQSRTSAARASPRGLELSRSVTTIRHDESEASFEAPSTRIARGPTLADRKAGSGGGGVSQSQSGLAGAGSDAHVTKSIARLRALRDAKRNAKVRFGDEPEVQEEAEVAPPLSSSSSPPPPRRVVEPSYERLPAPTRPRVMPPPLGASLGVRGRQPSARVGLPTGVRPVRA